MTLPTLNNSRHRTQRLPSWLVKRAGFSPEIHELKSKMRVRGLHTVCEEARCPNLGECWSQKTATFMILGDICTRHCGFCSVGVDSLGRASNTAGRPLPVDVDEPRKVAGMVASLGLRHAVITCVARDDLADGGAAHFAGVIGAVRQESPDCRIEVLTTDFGLKFESMETVCRARPDVFNHNLETVERLSPKIRHRASYRASLEFLHRIKGFDPTMPTKSGLMVGLGEEFSEIVQSLRDLRSVGCEILTIGQYLQPTSGNLPVVEFIEPQVFAEYERVGYEMGFRSVASGPFVRSSYQAEALWNSNE